MKSRVKSMSVIGGLFVCISAVCPPKIIMKNYKISVTAMDERQYDCMLDRINVQGNVNEILCRSRDAVPLNVTIKEMKKRIERKSKNLSVNGTVIGVLTVVSGKTEDPTKFREGILEALHSVMKTSNTEQRVQDFTLIIRDIIAEYA